MNRTPRLSNTGIEYLDKVWNFTSGCLEGCSYCYARPITKRFTNHYPNGFEPTIYAEALLSPLYLKKPSRIGVCYMGDLFTDCPEFNPERKNILHGFTEDGSSWEDISLKRLIYYVIDSCPQHTFIFLTKQPQNLLKFSPFPDNCRVGVTTVGDFDSFSNALGYLWGVTAKVKYLSIEPFLFEPKVKNLWFQMEQSGINQVIIGAQTKPTVYPKIEWVREIVEAADKAGIPVFLKNNLKPLLGQLTIDDKWAWAKDLGYGGLQRQEVPR